MLGLRPKLLIWKNVLQKIHWARWKKLSQVVLARNNIDIPKVFEKTTLNHTHRIIQLSRTLNLLFSIIIFPTLSIPINSPEGFQLFPYFEFWTNGYKHFLLLQCFDVFKCYMLKSVIDLHANEPLKTRSLYACSIIIWAGLLNTRQH